VASGRFSNKKLKKIRKRRLRNIVKTFAKLKVRLPIWFERERDIIISGVFAACSVHVHG